MNFTITKEMIKNSLVNKGDVARIVEVIRKANSGQDISIAFLGGSITEGCNATSFEKCYASRVYSWFKEKFKNININYINAGGGATGSIIGVHRVQKEVLSKNPDIIFIDFAVNDTESMWDKIGYESLIRRILAVKKNPALIEIFMSDCNFNNVQEQQIEIGKRYNLPMISFRNAIYQEIKANKLEWNQVSDDEIHPNDYGHFIIAELLIDFINNIINNLDGQGKDKVELGAPLYGDKYISGKILNNKNLQVSYVNDFLEDNEGFQVFKEGWRYISDNGGKATLIFEVEGKNIFLLYKKSIKKTAGKLHVKVDGTKAMLVNTYFKGGWGEYAETRILVNDLEIGKHKVEIRVVDEEKPVEVRVMGLLVS